MCKRFYHPGCPAPCSLPLPPTPAISHRPWWPCLPRLCPASSVVFGPLWFMKSWGINEKAGSPTKPGEMCEDGGNHLMWANGKWSLGTSGSHRRSPENLGSENFAVSLSLDISRYGYIYYWDGVNRTFTFFRIQHCVPVLRLNIAIYYHRRLGSSLFFHWPRQYPRFRLTSCGEGTIILQFLHVQYCDGLFLVCSCSLQPRDHPFFDHVDHVHDVQIHGESLLKDP